MKNIYAILDFYQRRRYTVTALQFIFASANPKIQAYIYIYII